MLVLDSDMLECDLAETYGILDYRTLPPARVAMFAIGLRDESRIKMKMAGCEQPLDRILLAGCFDKLSLLFWAKTEDGVAGRNRPKSVLSALNGDSAEEEVDAFGNAEEFLEAWNRKD